MTLENSAQIGKLKPHKTTREEIARLLAAARRHLKDARHADISPESRFDIAYKAVMQCAADCRDGKWLPALDERARPSRYRHSELAENGWPLE